MLGREGCKASIGACRQRFKLPLTHAVRTVASSGSAGNFKQTADVQMPNGVFWLDKSAHKHDVVYGQVGSNGVHLETLVNIGTVH